jgi:hypothetical protein
MMAEFRLPVANQIRGDQLADEILQATGIDIGQGIRQRLTFREPDVVVIPDADVGNQAAEIQAAIDAHVSDPHYFQDDREETAARGAWQDLRDQWQNELDYLEAAIPAVDAMDLAGLRAYVKRLGQENLRVLRSFALLFRRMS